MLLLFIFLKAEKCGEQSENVDQETQINNLRKEMESQFDAGFLSEASLYEHEKAAKQKLNDFADYLRIMADTSLFPDYREKTGEMILNLFISDTVQVKIVPDRNEKSQEFSIVQLVQSALRDEVLVSRMVYDSVQINRNFSRTGPDSYAALLTFIERTEISRDGRVSEASILRKIHAGINRQPRIFAADTLSVWVLRLGQME